MNKCALISWIFSISHIRFKVAAFCNENKKKITPLLYGSIKFRASLKRCDYLAFRRHHCHLRKNKARYITRKHTQIPHRTGKGGERERERNRLKERESQMQFPVSSSRTSPFSSSTQISHSLSACLHRAFSGKRVATLKYIWDPGFVGDFFLYEWLLLSELPCEFESRNSLRLIQ